jgi:hypothetical protein
MGVKFAPSIEGIFIEGKIALDFVDGTWWSQSLGGHSHLFYGHSETP